MMPNGMVTGCGAWSTLICTAQLSVSRILTVVGMRSRVPIWIPDITHGAIRCQLAYTFSSRCPNPASSTQRYLSERVWKRNAGCLCYMEARHVCEPSGLVIRKGIRKPWCAWQTQPSSTCRGARLWCIHLSSLRLICLPRSVRCPIRMPAANPTPRVIVCEADVYRALDDHAKQVRSEYKHVVVAGTHGIPSDTKRACQTCSC